MTVIITRDDGVNFAPMSGSRDAGNDPLKPRTSLHPSFQWSAVGRSTLQVQPDLAGD